MGEIVMPKNEKIKYDFVVFAITLLALMLIGATINNFIGAQLFIEASIAVRLFYIHNDLLSK